MITSLFILFLMSIPFYLWLMLKPTVNETKEDRAAYAALVVGTHIFQWICAIIFFIA